MENTEILESLSSLYPLQPFEREVVDTVVSQLSVKSTVRKEEGSGDRTEYINYCPTCNSDLRFYNLEPDSYSPYFKYCPFCGQRIEEN